MAEPNAEVACPYCASTDTCPAYAADTSQFAGLVLRAIIRMECRACGDIWHIYPDRET